MKHRKLFNLITSIIILITSIGALSFYLLIYKNTTVEGMKKYETDRFIIYYKTLKYDSIQIILEKLNHAYEKINNVITEYTSHKTKIIIYDDVKSFQAAYLGPILSHVFDDHIIGGAYQDIVMATSPYNSGKYSSFEDSIQVIVHEYIHTEIFKLNKNPNIWIDEGFATYYAEQIPYKKAIKLTKDIMEIDNINNFIDIDGYGIAYYFAEYLVTTFNSEQLIELIKTDNYNKSLGLTKEETINKFIAYYLNLN